MPVGDQDTLESVVGYALGDIQNEVQQVLHADIDGSREIHVVGFKPIGNRREQQNLSIGAAGRFLANGLDQKIVGIQRQVVSMVFDRADRLDHHRLAGHQGFQLLPGVLLIPVALAFHGLLVSVPLSQPESSRTAR